MPEGLNRSGDFRNGTPVTLPKNFGTPITSLTPAGNPIPTSGTEQNLVNWLPDPAHFGNVIAPATTPLAAPTFSEPGGTYSGPQSITLTVDAHATATYYTTDGSTPSTGSTLYTGAITIPAPSTTVLKAFSHGTGAFSDSSVASATYVTTASTPALLAHTGVNDNGAGGTQTTPAIDTTGATLLVAFATVYSNGVAPTFSDSKGNTWHPLVQQSGFIGNVQIAYAWNPTVGTGHTFTVTNPGNNGVGYSVMAFSNVQTSSDPLVGGSSLQNNAASSATVQPGSVTVATDDVIFACMGEYSAFAPPPTMSVDSGFVIPDLLSHDGSGPSVSGISAYLISAGSAVNPTFTSTDATKSPNAAIAAFAHA